jgi:hypothetical protein
MLLLNRKKKKNETFWMESESKLQGNNAALDFFKRTDNAILKGMSFLLVESVI